MASGAGAAALACLNQLVSLGAKVENIWVTDLEGVVYKGREKLMDRWKAVFAQETDARTLAEVIAGADIFLGLSAGGVLKPELLKQMAPDPLILALANPNPEIMPEEAVAVRPDAMICTGRSDYPNQVNNVLCFPYIFRGALDVGASTINEAMKQAAVNAIAGLARETPSDVVARAYGGEARLFGKDSLIPAPFDPRLILRVAPAVAKAAMESGVATRPIADFDAYCEGLERFVFRSGFVMRQIFAAAKKAPKRVIYADGEDERVLRAAEVLLEEGIARPILIGRPAVIETRIKRYGLSIRPGHRLRDRQPRGRPALPRLCADLCGGGGPPRHHARCGAHAGAHLDHRHRRAGAPARRGGCDDLRPRRPLSRQAAPHPRHRGAGAGRARIRGDEPDDHHARHRVPHRHPCAGGAFGRGDGRHGADVRGACRALRHHAQGGAGRALRLRRLRHAGDAADAGRRWP